MLKNLNQDLKKKGSTEAGDFFKAVMFRQRCSTHVKPQDPTKSSVGPRKNAEKDALDLTFQELLVCVQC